jgi:hypothetical protein
VAIAVQRDETAPSSHRTHAMDRTILTEEREPIRDTAQRLAISRALTE